MPKAARSSADIEEVKNEILNQAMSLIKEKGFNNLSMRMLAERLGMTAANIYNYYTNKDDLYLSIRTKGFELLHHNFEQASMSGKNHRTKMENMVRAYIDFGIKNPNYYDIMFSMNTPKYTDYLGTELEQKAWIERKSAMKVFDITARVLSDPLSLKASGKGGAKYLTLKFWTMLHGIVSLYNSGILKEAEKDTETFRKRMIHDLICLFAPENTESKKISAA